MNRPCEVWFLDGTKPLDGGGVMTIEFKIWAYKSHEVYWEFRRPAMALHATLPQSFDLNRFIKSNWPSWQANFARMGCGDATVKPS